MELTYKVTGLKTLNIPDLGNFVSEATWVATTVENEIEASVAGVSYFEVTEANADEFVPYEDISEELVIGWIEQKVTGGYYEHLVFLLNKELDSKRFTETVADSFPWDAENIS